MKRVYFFLTSSMILEKIRNIKERIDQACRKTGRNPETVTLIAVSKTFGPDLVIDASGAGIVDFGENYVQELVDKRQIVASPQIRWHFIGHLQTNKVKYIAEWIAMIHSVDSVSLAKEINKRAVNAGRIIDVLIEVNTSDEVSKFGIKPDGAAALLKEIALFPNLRVRGLMTIGPFLPEPEGSLPSFRRLRNLFDEANRSGNLAVPMDHLSMGMTHDFEVAIQEGATMVRIGTAIFGSRRRVER
jgi:pyridoxal phosphate enzyme (YggS family)